MGDLPPARTQLLHVVTLSAFAVAQPLFDLLGRNASFFVAHRASGADVVGVAVAALVAVPLVLIAVKHLLGWASPRAGRTFHVATIGALGALTLVPPAVRALELRWPVALLAGIVAAAVIAAIYVRKAAFRRFVTIVGPAPLVFAVLFVFASPARDLVFPAQQAVASSAPASSDTPVMVVLLDELSLPSIITPDGRIDSTRYPGFARLAGMSTWYRQATTSGLRTDQAVPAALTGRRVPKRQVPSSFTYPDNAFTLLSKTHRLHVREFVSQLCPPSLCPVEGSEAVAGLRSLFADTAIVYGHIVLPNDVAARWLPPLGDRWAGFSRDNTGGAGGNDPVAAWLRTAIDERETQHEGAVFDRFLQDVQPSEGRPTFSWLHLQVPHPPWRYLPNGQTYDPGSSTPGYRNFRWGSDQYLATEVLQRSLLQTKFADRMVDALLDHLEDTDQLEDMMLAVISDHGATWERSATRRNVEGKQSAALLGVPLFVKYPGHTSGQVDDRNAEIVDLLPTIGDVAGVDIPWETHGISLRSAGDGHDVRRVFDGAQERVVRYSFTDAKRYARYVESLFGSGGGRDDLYAFGRHRGLLGRRAAGIDGNPVEVRYDRRPYRDVDTTAASLPVFFRATLDRDGRAGTPIAIALNGRVAGVGQTYEEDGAVRIAVMLSPRYLIDGANGLRVYALRNGDR